MVIVCFVMSSCANNKINYKGVTTKNIGTNRCGIKNDDLTMNVASYDRGPVNGTIDEDMDSSISVEEAFSTWDFKQVVRVLESGIEWDSYVWTNLDTCYYFTMIPGDFYEDPNQELLWKTCRDFAVKVKDNKGKVIGSIDQNTACRNFGTHRWIVL